MSRQINCLQFWLQCSHLPSSSWYTEVEMVLVLVRCLWSLGRLPSLSLSSSPKALPLLPLFSSVSETLTAESPSRCLGGESVPLLCFGGESPSIWSLSNSTQLPRLFAASSDEGYHKILLCMITRGKWIAHVHCTFTQLVYNYQFSVYA